MNKSRPDDAAAARVETFGEIVGHRFADPTHLSDALTHRSAIDRKQLATRLPFANERLEFLGDRVLSLALVDMLLARFPDESEGELARRLSTLASAETLELVARRIGLGEHLIMGESEAGTGGREKAAILSDACEALIGALYRDGGMDVARAFVEARWRPLVEGAIRPPRDPKTELQEWAQGRGLPLPTYRETGRSGPHHAPIFTIEVSVTGLPTVGATGASKREAERDAAAALLGKIR